jgi:hypothetical protein
VAAQVRRRPWIVPAVLVGAAATIVVLRRTRRP